MLGIWSQKPRDFGGLDNGLGSTVQQRGAWGPLDLRASGCQGVEPEAGVLVGTSIEKEFNLMCVHDWGLRWLPYALNPEQKKP